MLLNYTLSLHSFGNFKESCDVGTCNIVAFLAVLLSCVIKIMEEVDSKLKNIMINIFHNLDDASKKYGLEGDYVAGANIAGFLKVADAMKAQGIV